MPAGQSESGVDPRRQSAGPAGYYGGTGRSNSPMATRHLRRDFTPATDPKIKEALQEQLKAVLKAALPILDH